MAILRVLARENLENLFVLGQDIFRFKLYTVVAMDLLSEDLHKAYFNKHLSPRMIRPIAQQILTALAELVRLGIIHGDIKPMNLMLVNSKTLKVKVSEISFSFAVISSDQHFLITVLCVFT